VLLTVKYAPKRLDDIVGNERAKAYVRAWINKALNRQAKPLLIYGPPGVGKTSTALALAREYNLELVELSPSQLVDKNKVERVIGNAAHSSSLFGKQRLVLIDDVDGFSPSEDRGVLKALVNALKKAKCPVILTAQDYWDKRLVALRNVVDKVEYKRVAPSSVFSFLKRVAEREGIEVSDDVLKDIAYKSDGDVRSALNDLMTLMPAYRERQHTFFEYLSQLFKSTTVKRARVISMYVDHDFLKALVDENIVKEYEHVEDVYRAYLALARADVFDGRIKRRQYWGLLRYSSVLLTAGVALAKTQRYRKFTAYSFPHYLTQMAKTQRVRAIKRSIALKLKHLIHGGLSDAYTLLGVLALHVRHGLRWDELSEDEVKFLTQGDWYV
jgi:replication factor C large subunit